MKRHESKCEGKNRQEQVGTGTTVSSGSDQVKLLLFNNGLVLGSSDLESHLLIS